MRLLTQCLSVRNARSPLLNCIVERSIFVLHTHLSKAVRISVLLALLVGAMLFSSPAKSAQAAGFSPTTFCYLNGLPAGPNFPIFDAAGFVGKSFRVSPIFPLPNGQTYSVWFRELSNVGGNNWLV